MQIINNRPRIYTVGNVTLQPGPNTVADKDAEKFLAHKAVKDRIAIGHLSVPDSAAKAAEEAEAAEEAKAAGGKAAMPKASK